MAKYAQLVATGLPHGVLLTIKDTAGNQVSNLFPEPDSTGPDNRPRYADGNGSIAPDVYLPNGTYAVAYSGGSQSVTVSGATGLPAASVYVDPATQAELDADIAAQKGTYVPSLIATGSVVGAVADGVTNNDAIWARIKAALPNGGVVYFPPGVYIFSAQADLTSVKNLTLRGGGLMGDRTDPLVTELRWTSTGTTAKINATLSSGFCVEGLAIVASHASFTGDIVDVTGSPAGVPSYRPTFRYAYVGGTSTATSARSCIYAGNSVELMVEECVLTRADYAIVGRDAGRTQFCTAVRWIGGRTADLGIAAILNPHEAWNVIGTVWECTRSGAPAGIVGTTTYPALGVNLVGVGMWDAVATGTWIDFWGDGLLVSGSRVYLAPGAPVITYIKAHGTVRGLRSIGNTVTGAATNVYVATADTPAVTGVHFEDDLINGVTDNTPAVTGLFWAAPFLNRRRPTKLWTSTTVTLGVNDLGYVHLIDATAGAVTLTMPDVALKNMDGADITIKKVDNTANVVTIGPVGGQRVDNRANGGGFSVALSTEQQAYTFVATNQTALNAFMGWHSVAKV